MKSVVACYFSVSDGDWSYAWDMENRLISAENATSRLEFQYDFMSRRIEKKVYDNETLVKHIKFLYRGYKLVEERDGLNNDAPLRRYTWQPTALDAPLYVKDLAQNTIYYYHTDANKNVTELTDSTGTVVAHYEYSPFGAVTSATGAYAEYNPFRFSSEYHDDETNLVYYNYRYYSPTLGRWTSRDPIEEDGGANLYRFLSNSSFNFVDIYGLIMTRSKDNCFVLHFYSSGTLWSRNKDNNYLSHVAISTTGQHDTPVGFNPDFSGIYRFGFGGSIDVEKRKDETMQYKCCCLAENELVSIDAFLSEWRNADTLAKQNKKQTKYKDKEWRIDTNNCVTFALDAITDTIVCSSIFLPKFRNQSMFYGDYASPFSKDALPETVNRPELLRKIVAEADCEFIPNETNYSKWQKAGGKI